MITIPQYPTSTFLDHLIRREGMKQTVYLDSVGKLTVGVGHLVTKEDELELGDRISVKDVDNFLTDDSLKSWQAAVDQAVELDKIELPFIEALASVNFQLGTSWYKIHKKTWQYMMEGKWLAATEEVEDSLWYKQTPIRVKDFQEVLCGISYDEALDGY